MHRLPSFGSHSVSLPVAVGSRARRRETTDGSRLQNKGGMERGKVCINAKLKCNILLLYQTTHFGPSVMGGLYRVGLPHRDAL